jgi:hypothetical protein
LRPGGAGLVFENIKINDPEIMAVEWPGKKRKIADQKV